MVIYPCQYTQMDRINEAHQMPWKHAFLVISTVNIAFWEASFNPEGIYLLIQLVVNHRIKSDFKSYTSLIYNFLFFKRSLHWNISMMDFNINCYRINWSKNTHQNFIMVPFFCTFSSFEFSSCVCLKWNKLWLFLSYWVIWCKTLNNQII
jgi:hypothetical protein